MLYGQKKSILKLTKAPTKGAYCILKDQMIIYFRACEKQETISYVTRFNNENKTEILRNCWSALNSSINDSDTVILVEDNVSEETLEYITSTSKAKETIVVSVPEHNWEVHQHTVDLIKTLEEYANKYPDELHYIVEDDYLHIPGAVRLLQANLENWQGFAVSYDYPDRYVDIVDCKVILGLDRHWRTINSSTMTVIAKGKVWLQHIEDLKAAAPTSNDKVFEQLYKNTPCISPLPSLSAHLTDRHLSPFIDWNKLWNLLPL